MKNAYYLGLAVIAAFAILLFAAPITFHAFAQSEPINGSNPSGTTDCAGSYILQCNESYSFYFPYYIISIIIMIIAGGTAIYFLIGHRV